MGSWGLVFATIVVATAKLMVVVESVVKEQLAKLAIGFAINLVDH